MSDPHQGAEDDDDFAAAELALGLAEEEVLQAGRARVLSDRAFAQHVAAWQERLVTLTDDIRPRKPPKRVKKAILAQVFPKTHVPFFERLWLWQGLTVAALVMVAYLAFPMLRPEQPGGVSGPIYAATLTSEASDTQVFAVLDPARLGIALQRVNAPVPEGRVLELWAILPDEAPVSLGVLPEDGVHLPLPEVFADQLDRLTLAISDEPPGGSPTGAPTGEVRAVGTVSEI